MPHINLEENVPGIRSLVMFRPDTGEHLYHLVQVLLRGSSSSLQAGEKELIAAYVSNRNGCMFCTNSHAAASRCFYGHEKKLVDEVLTNLQHAPVNDKLRSLLELAGKVQVSGEAVCQQDVNNARQAGASDEEIHDAVLIAATFSMFNRYVDGLATYTPRDPGEYQLMGERMAGKGYVLPVPNATNSTNTT